MKRLHIDALEDFDIEAATKMAESIGFYHADVNQAAQILLKMWQCFKENDATLVEINPLAKIGDPDDESSKTLCALDAKISLDDNAAFRHDGWKRFADPVHVDPFEQKAREHGLHYVHLQGSVGVIGNGAGLVMSSLDAVSGAGEDQGTNVKPANFLDIGGGASAEVMCGSLEIVLSDPQVESVLINVYGGITSCEQVAKGILEALDQAWQFQASGSPFRRQRGGRRSTYSGSGRSCQSACCADHGRSRTAGRASCGQWQGGSLK